MFPDTQTRQARSPCTLICFCLLLSVKLIYEGKHTGICLKDSRELIKITCWLTSPACNIHAKSLSQGSESKTTRIQYFSTINIIVCVNWKSALRCSLYNEWHADCDRTIVGIQLNYHRHTNKFQVNGNNEKEGSYKIKVKIGK